MRRALPTFALAVTLLAGGLLLGGCLGNRHLMVDGDEFLAAMPRGVHSVRAGSYLGAHDGRVYLHLWNGMPWLLGGGDHVYSCRIADLPAEARAAVGRGEAPWPELRAEAALRPPEAR